MYCSLSIADTIRSGKVSWLKRCPHLGGNYEVFPVYIAVSLFQSVLVIKACYFGILDSVLIMEVSWFPYIRCWLEKLYCTCKIVHAVFVDICLHSLVFCCTCKNYYYYYHYCIVYPGSVAQNTESHEGSDRSYQTVSTAPKYGYNK